MKQHRLFIGIAFITCTAHIVAQKAFVAVPIADLVGEPLASAHTYQELPLCGGSLNPFVSCKRMHQLLYNEIIEVVEERQEQVRVAIPNFFYLREADTKPRNEYWMLKENILLLKDLEQAGLDVKKIPAPITRNPLTLSNNQILTLILPFFDPTTKMPFSAGTRFVVDTTHTSTDQYKVFVFDKALMQFVATTIPKQLCLIESGSCEQNRIAQFVQVVRAWAHLPQGYIPYVWGGTSFSAPALSNKTTQITQLLPPSSYFTIDGYTQGTKTGLDCTGLVARAAQMCGIPYYFKNSISVAHNLAPLKADEALSEGDLIWVPRHVMVVGSLEKNTLIEARHYSHGYGKVHEIELAKVFKGIRTYKELRAAYKEKKPLYRMDIKGEVRDTFPEFKLLRLGSVWK